MKNRNFNAQRFVNLFKHDLLINYKLYGIVTAGVWLIVLLILVLSMANHYRNFSFDNYLASWIPIMIVGGAISVSSAFAGTKNKVELTSYLMLPGSALEKFIVQVLVRFILFYLMLVTIYRIDAHVARWFVHTIDFDEPIYIAKFNFETVFEPMLKDLSKTNLEYLVTGAIGTVVSFLFVSAIHFNKFKLFKGLLALMVIVFGFVCLAVVCSHIFLPERTQGFEVATIDYYIMEGLHIVEFYFNILLCTTPFILLGLAYYLFKEKEV